MSIKITSYNCQSATANLEFLKMLSADTDIILLQETFLSDHNANILSTINSDFDYSFVSATRKEGNFSGRSSGGLSCLWRKAKNINILPVYYTNRITGLKISVHNIDYLILNIYGFCDYGNLESLLNYKSFLADLSNIFTGDKYDDIVAIGDFNCSPYRGRFYKELENIVSNFSLKVIDVDILPADTFTYVSRNTVCSTSWLDHIVTSNSDIIGEIEIKYGVTFEDHIPISCILKIPDIPVIRDNVSPKNENTMKNSIKWDKVTNENCKQYSEFLDYLVENFFSDAIMCREPSCQKEDHKNEIDKTYDFICKAILLAGETYLPGYPNNNRYKQVPGWNIHCKQLYQDAREKFLTWMGYGKVRYGQLFEDMKNSRSAFRNALKFCEKNEWKIKKQNFVNSFLERNKGDFWKLARKQNIKNNCSQTINGKSDPGEILEIFKCKFKEILDDPASNIGGSGKISTENVDEVYMYYFLNPFMDNNINKIKDGLGWDNIHSNHLKFSNGKTREFIGRMFASMLSHSYVPKRMIFGCIKPTLKNNKLCKTDANNFRPVMNSSMMLKLFEYSIVPSLNKYLKVNSLQFGFTPDSNCAKAITILKEVVLNYKNGGSNVHIASIDLSKAYDKINIKILIDKLLQTDLPIPIVKIIAYMLRNSYANIFYNGHAGEEFLIKNGVRQGGILSSILFNFYINEVINKVSILNWGCNLNLRKLNIIGYADDLIVMAPSPAGLQNILNSLGETLKALCLKINTDKSVHMVFKTNRAQVNSHKICLAGRQLCNVAQIKYLGVVITENLAISADVDRASGDFLKQFNAFYHKFNFLPSDIIYFMFRTYTTTFYGCNTWFEQSINDNNIRKIAVCYHKAVKKIAGKLPWDSNHESCSIVNVNIFKHLLVKRIYNHFCSLIKQGNGICASLKYYFMFESQINAKLTNMFQNKYDLIDYKYNDNGAVRARIDFIERHEPRSFYNYTAY